MFENGQAAPEHFSSKGSDAGILQLGDWSRSNRQAVDDSQRRNGDRSVAATILPPAAEVFANQQMVNYDATTQLLKDNGRLFDALDAVSGRNGKISQNDLQVFLGEPSNVKHFSRHQLDAVKYLLDNWDNENIKGMKTENSLFMTGYLTPDSLAKGLGFNSRETLQATVDGQLGRPKQETQSAPLPPGELPRADVPQQSADAVPHPGDVSAAASGFEFPQKRNDAGNLMAAHELLKNNGQLFDAIDTSAHGGRHEGKISQNDVYQFLIDPINAKHFSREQMEAVKYIDANWDMDVLRPMQTDTTLFMNGYLTRDSMAKGLGFDSRESMTRAFDQMDAAQKGPEQLMQPPPEVHRVPEYHAPQDNRYCPPNSGMQVEFERGETVYDVAKRTLTVRSHVTGERVNTDAIFRECNRIMVNSGFPDAHLEGKTHITQRDLPSAWNSLRNHQVLTLYTDRELAAFNALPPGQLPDEDVHERPLP